MNYGRNKRGHYKGKIHKQGITSAKDMTIEHPQGRRVPHHRLN